MSTSETPPRALAFLETELVSATETLEAAIAASREASRSETVARNRLNAIQKEITERFFTMRKAAPHDSDWGQANKQPQHREG